MVCTKTSHTSVCINKPYTEMYISRDCRLSEDCSGKSTVPGYVSSPEHSWTVKLANLLDSRLFIRISLVNKTIS